jgi:Na+-driven multidrug efflux pump
MSTENLFESIEPATNLIAEPRNNFFLEIKALIKLFLPLLLSQITYAISLFAAILMVGHLGKDALAALALVSSIYSALCAFFMEFLLVLAYWFHKILELKMIKIYS